MRSCLPRFSVGNLLFASLLWAAFVLYCPAVLAVPPEALLPSHTVGFVSIRNLQEFDAALHRTQLAGLFEDPAMRAFRDAARDRIKKRVFPNGDVVSLSWEQIVGTPSGEMAIAVLHPSVNTKSAVLLMDVTGRPAEASQLLDAIAREFQAHGATLEKASVAGVNVAAFKLPERTDQQERRFPEAVFFIQDNYLVGTDNRQSAGEIIKRLKAGSTGSLAENPSFAITMRRAMEASGSSKPDVRWWVDPFGFAESQRAAIRNTAAPQRDILKILRNQGFDAIESMGGWVHIADGQHEVLHHTFIHAPNFNEGNPTFRLAAQALQLRNAVQDAPPAWAPRDLAGCTLVNIDIAKGFDKVGTLIDEWYRIDDKDTQKFFEELLENLKNDPNGPKIDLRDDVVAYLGNRVTILGDVSTGQELTESERNLVAVEAKDENKLYESISRLMDGDPNAKPRKLGDIQVWEVEPQSTGKRPRNRKAPAARQPVRLKSSSGVAVVHGHLFVSSHYDFLVNVVASKQPPLSESADFQQVNQRLAQLGAGKTSVRGFVRRDEANRGNYELLKSGKMPQSKTVLGQLLNTLLTQEHAPGAARQPEIDGSSLPSYEVISRYLGPGGSYITSEKEGALLVGCVLKK